MDIGELKKVVDAIDPSQLDYTEWTQVGMAMKHEGFSSFDWDSWSQRDNRRYHDGECFSKWETFQSTGVTGGTLVEFAKRQGWKGSRPAREDDNIVMSWDSIITVDADQVFVDRSSLVTAAIEEPGDGWDGRKDLIKYLNALFHPDEFVGYLVSSRLDKDGRWKPSSQGVYTKTVGQLIDQLNRYQILPEAIGDWNPDAGAWIRFNPLDGEGVSDANVTSYRHALVESDELSVGDQLALIRSLELPTAAIVSSGGKSIHAIVKIDASSHTEYKQRIDYLYKVCEKNGLKLDKQNSNPSRLSRLPGVTRGAHKQFLISTKEGKDSFQDWKDWIDEMNDDMGDPELPPADGKRPQLADELIQQILRKGHKMLVAGPSKAGKSFLLLQLGLSIAMGEPWLGKKCAQGKVLYVNLELDHRSAWARVYDILEERDQTYEDLHDNFMIWNLRGRSVPMDKLALKLIRRSRKHRYDAIIIDPIYKVLTGDENNAADMALFANQFDKVATELGCAVIYCHHHSKGYQGGKRSMDRASGSGVFARDPDALLDMTELEIKPSKRDDFGLKPQASVWRIEGTLREFPSFEPIDCIFEYPQHIVDESGAFKELQPEAEKPKFQRGSENAAEKRIKKAESDLSRFEMEFANYTSFNRTDNVPMSHLTDFFGVVDKTMRNRIAKVEGYYIKNGSVYEVK